VGLRTSPFALIRGLLRVGVIGEGAGAAGALVRSG
jgi:hypothetical protein